MFGRAEIGSLPHPTNRWAETPLSCRPANRTMAEQGIRLAYAAAGLPPPERIVWCGGPLAIARELASAAPAQRIGANVKAEIFDAILDDVGTIAEILCKETLCDAIALNARAKLAAAGIEAVVVGAVGTELSRFSVRVRHALLKFRGLPRLLPKSSFGEVSIGPAQLASLEVYRHLHDTACCQVETRRMRGLWMIAAGAGWIVPHQHMCWASERPDRLQLDAKGQLHCADGPALRYRDGWAAWAWKGVEVPAWAIDHPERISVSTLDSTIDPVLRRCLIEIMTPERLIASGAAKRLARDEMGTLWGMTWQYRGVTLDEWKAVEVVDGSPGPDGSRKHHVLPVPADLRTARDAVAWTYG